MPHAPYRKEEPDESDEAGLLTLSLAACSGGGDQTAEVKAAQAKLDAATSFESVYRTEMDYSMADADGEAVSVSVTNQMKVTLFTAPEPRLMADTTTELTSGEEHMSQNMTIYMLKEGEGYSQYITDGSRWAKGTVASSDMEEMTPTDSIQLFLAEGAAFRKVGTETLEGGDAVKYENTLKGAQLVEALDNVQLLDSISSMSEDQQSKIRSDLGKNLKGLTVHIWVDEATGYPVRYEMDLTAILEDMTDSISKTLGGHSEKSGRTMTRAVVSMTCANFNSAAEIVLPDAAADAEPMG